MREVLTVGECLERQATGPRAAALGRVRPQLEDVVGLVVESVDDDRRLGAVDGEVVVRPVGAVVQHLVEDDRAVAQAARRAVPPQPDARRRHAGRREVLRRTARNCASRRTTGHFIIILKPSFSANPSHCSLSVSSSGLTT